MGKITGFLEYRRRVHANQPAGARRRHFGEFTRALGEEGLRQQGARCMDCGIPYCHHGCPVDNLIPDWCELVWRGDWRGALLSLHSTNNFPEFTGRVCPAPCEAACTLNISKAPVSIKDLECAIIDRGFKEGWVRPLAAARRSGRSAAVVGSGPAGLACAQQLARAGHDVVVYEKNDRAGGLLRYGIPDFKMAKSLIDRRLAQMEAEGVSFRCNAWVGRDIEAAKLLAEHDVLILAGGCEAPRDLEAPGRDGDGVHFAMPYLVQQNRRLAGDNIIAGELIDAAGLRVAVIGGGDTGSDCIGTANRQGARSIVQLEIMPKPPQRESDLVWPDWPLKLRTSSSQEEGCERRWSVATVGFRRQGGKLTALELSSAGQQAGEKSLLEIDLALLAMGFIHPVHDDAVAELELALDERGNVRASERDWRTSHERVFVCGDMRRGQSLVVWAIREGRLCASAAHAALTDGALLEGRARGMTAPERRLSSAGRARHS